MQKNATRSGRAGREVCSIQMTRIVVFTDIHFEADSSDNGIKAVERLRTGILHAQQYVDDIDHIVITGDLAHRGDVESYQLLKNSLPPTGTPTVLMLGNHDNRENFLQVFPEIHQDQNGHIQHVIDDEKHRLIFLDTLDGPPYDYPLSHRGHLCTKRIEWLEEQLKTAANRDCIIFMHHHPHEVGFKAMDTIKLVNGDAFYEVIEEFNNVKHISCGHVHRTISGNHRGISFSIFKSTVGQMPMKFNSMDFHMETDEPAAYGIIDLTEHGVSVHTEDYGLTDLDMFE